ncbi:DegT/DnrJ/EryC1/StrS family aminotransferase [Chloroflexota bacterium]
MKLALLGGKKVREKPFPPHPIIGEEEKRAVRQVLESGKLSTFIASPGENFLGGAKIRQFEKDFAGYHGVKYAVAFNSATSGLHSAVAACGVKAGEEVIVPPYTFTSTATCVLMHNAIPVFADVKPDTFCLDPARIKAAITPRTRAIIPVHLFGNAADMDEIMAIAREHSLKVIEDCAQAPGAVYKGKYVGIIGNCGVFSFQETKNIMTGEGGMLITDDWEIAEIARMVRNHGEVVLESQKQRTYRSDILGWGYRMTELEAALGIEQLKKLDTFNSKRIELANYLAEGLASIEGLTPPVVYPNVKHVYYGFVLRYDEAKIGISRELFIKALVAEGIPFGGGYVKPLYLNPIYHENKPFIYNYFGSGISYDKGICPVAERLHEKELVSTVICRPPATRADMDDVVRAIKKILENRDELKQEA